MAQIDEIKNSEDEDAGKDTIFDGVLKSKLPEEEKATARLGHEAQLTVLAGQDTTGKLDDYYAFPQMLRTWHSKYSIVSSLRASRQP